MKRKELAAITVYGIDDGRSSARVILERTQAPECPARWAVTTYRSYGTYEGQFHRTKRAGVEAFAMAVVAMEVESADALRRLEEAEKENQS